MWMHHGHLSSDQIKGRKIDRRTLRRAWGFARPYRRWLFGYLGLAIAASLVGVLPPMVFKRLIDHSVPQRDLGSVNVLAAIAVVLAVAGAGLGACIRWLGAKVGEGIIADTRKALYDHVQRMPIAFFTRTQTGSLMSRLNNDVVGAQSAFTFTLRTAVTDLLTVAFTLAVMIALDWRITLGVLAIVPFPIFISKKVGARQQRVARAQMELNAKMNTVMTERFNVAGALLVKLFGRPTEEAAQFSEAADRVASMGVKRTTSGMLLMLTLPLVGALGTAAIYWWGIRSVIEGSIGLGTVVALAAYVQRIYGPLTDLASARVDFVTAFVSFDRIFEVLDAPHTIADRPGATPLPAGSGDVVFDTVWFRYPAADQVSVASLEGGGPHLPGEPGAWVLADVSFRAAPGTMTALVGPSGAGKTSLSSLVPRLYDVTDGAVRIDGVDVRSVTLQSLTDAIGVVTQDAHLFHDTIAANLRYAKPHASQEELVAACRAAQIHDMIAGLPDGYATMVGERGYRLSGGEKQRLAIARVLLKNPRIVILDEATAHLDSETESQIQDALAVALQGRTSIVIAHRLSTIQAADQILVLDGGKVVERGTHQSLVASAGLYRELYETQYLRGRPDSAPTSPTPP